MIDGGLILFLLALYWILEGGEHRPSNELGPFGLLFVILFYGTILVVAIRLAQRLAKRQERSDQRRINRYRRDWEQP